MGSFVGKAMDTSMQKQQEFMLKNQQEMLERQIQMNNYMREQQMAMQLAKARDIFVWWAAFYGTSLFASIAGFAKSKHPAAFIPLIPFTFIVGYQADLALGNKMDRIRDEADRILKEEHGQVALPQSLPTINLLDERRNQPKTDN